MGLDATWKSWWMSCVTRRRSARPPCEDPRDSASWYRNLDFLSALTCPTPSHYGIIYYRCSLWESKHRSHVTLCDHYGRARWWRKLLFFSYSSFLPSSARLLPIQLFSLPLHSRNPPFVASNFAISNGSSHHFFAKFEIDEAPRCEKRRGVR